jgi:nitroreductase
MSVQTSIQERRSIRAYKNTPIEDDKLEIILNALRFAPSARNRQEWKFIVVKDPETRRKLVDAANNKPYLIDSPVVIVACATESEYVMACGQPAGTVDVSIAISFLILQAQELGLGTCWLGNFNEQEVKKVLDIPENIRIVAITPLGYPAQEPDAKPRKSLEEIIVYDRYK